MSQKPSNRQLVARLKAVECPDSTFGGFEPPLVLAEGLGSHVKDSEGRRYIDLCAGFGTLALGHNSAVQQRIFSRYKEGQFAPVVQGMGDVYGSEAKVALLSRLSSALPGQLSTCALSVTGSQAVEFALRTAYLVNQRPKVLCFTGCYHGTDLGVLSYASSAQFKEPFSGLIHDRATFAPYGAAPDAIEEQLKAEGTSPSQLSAVLVEPIQGRAGTVLPPADWLDRLAAWAKGHGILVIYDEIFTGMGRAGSLCLAQRHHCDILCVGKGLGGGMPISACISTPELMAAWPESTGEARHTGTFFGHPLTCAIATGVLEQILADDLPQRAAKLGAKAMAYLRQGVEGSPFAVRGQGLMIALAGPAGSGVALMANLRSAGVHSLVSGSEGQCLAITPALTIPEPLLFEALDHVITAAQQVKLTAR